MPKLSEQKLKDLRRYAVSMVDLAFIHDDLLALLNEVEEGRKTVEVGNPLETVTLEISLYRCSSCGTVRALTKLANYCPNCGVKLVWKE